MDTRDDGAKEVLERVLDLLLALAGARMAAVFVADGPDHEPALVVGQRIDQTALENVRSAWRYGRDALEVGQRFTFPGGAVVEPILAERNLRALVYLDRMEGECPAPDLELIKTLVVKRLAGERGESAAAQPAMDEREHLLLLLERNEWNIARVARLLGLSRLTVYRRMSRLQISRPEDEALAGAASEGGA